MSRILAAALLAVAAVMPARGQDFVNLDFEQAEVVPNFPVFGFLDWSLAVPGWSHISVSGAEFVYYENTHLGYQPWYLLVDSVSRPDSLLEGRYSLSFSNGLLASAPYAPFVTAYLWQMGTIPANARYLRLLADGPVNVLIDGNVVATEFAGGFAYLADISAFAGRTVELKISNGYGEFQTPVTVDALAFLPIPEPGTHALMLVGLAGLATAMRRRRTPSSA